MAPALLPAAYKRVRNERDREKRFSQTGFRPDSLIHEAKKEKILKALYNSILRHDQEVFTFDNPQTAHYFSSK